LSDFEQPPDSGGSGCQVQNILPIPAYRVFPKWNHQLNGVARRLLMSDRNKE
jgi:hypothetical protein